ncbi:purine nucleoside permease [Cordyceps javanica]|uniref:Purine nucleoside permease n=1 Tax=Cordyceps javanica TaxID=43265 RepID=A0A545V5L1_9HYPO|nr:purine nucleoside permease [Cordyceps javanica]TQW08261.1 purine nucleoside permease [Cordyceps javanica]
MAGATVVTADVIAPKVMIVSMFAPEAHAWNSNFGRSGLGNLSSVSIPAPGLSMLFPLISCTRDAAVCHVTVGEGEVNAAASATALLLAPALDLRATYFLLSGIAGAHPGRATLGSVALARYAVQVGLQYEVDPRDAPDGWQTGYVPFGRDRPEQYPSVIYGSEVFELNVRLRDVAYDLASAAALENHDDDDDDDDEGKRVRALRAQYPAGTAATRPPRLVKCDVTTSDVYFMGEALAQAFDRTTTVWTNGTGAYCMSAQEDNAILEVLVRGAADRLVDFSRVVLMRAGANFDRPPPGVPLADFLAEAAVVAPQQPGQGVAARSMYDAGVRIVRGIVGGWDHTFARGVPADNYVGDIFGTLGGDPDFGTPALRLEAQRAAMAGGGLRRSKRRMRREVVPSEQAPARAAQQQDRQTRQALRRGRREMDVVANAKM